jgi:hypothetical protein
MHPAVLFRKVKKKIIIVYMDSRALLFNNNIIIGTYMEI